MVYYLAWQAELPSLPDNWQQYLPPYRIEKALAYRQEKDRVTSVLAFLLLRFALFKEFGITAMPQIETDENGKPFDRHNRRHFNLSHCDTAVACALDTTPVGVDVQDFRPVKENVIRKVCSAKEQVLLQQSDRPEALFAAFWASKEAYGKRIGQGIGYALQETCFCKNDAFPCVCKTETDIVFTDLVGSFALSVCAQNSLRIKQVSVEDLILFLRLL